VDLPFDGELAAIERLEDVHELGRVDAAGRDR
jgi:hypothetical protein